MTGDTKRWAVLAGILLVALTVRLGAAVWWQQRLGTPQAFGMPDTLSYWDLGHRLAAGEPYAFGGGDLRVFRAPGYPLLLAGLFRILGLDAPILAARLLGAALGTLAVALVVWLGDAMAGALALRPAASPADAGPVGLVAGALTAVYPGAIAMSVLVLAEALFCPLMLLHLVAWVRGTQSDEPGRRYGWACISGVVAGLAVLTRPSWLLFIPFVLLWMAVFSRNRWAHLKFGACLLLAMAVTMSPWWIRNYRVAGAFVPTTLQVGASLYDGLNRRASGASDMYFSESFYTAQHAADRAAGRSAHGFEVRLDRRLRDAASAWAAAHRATVMRLAGRKVVRMWNIWPNAEEFQGAVLPLLVAAGYVPLLALGWVGLWKLRFPGWPWLLCVLPALYFTLLHSVFVSSIRYRQPALLTWTILAAVVIAARLRPCCGIAERVGRTGAEAEP